MTADTTKLCTLCCRSLPVGDFPTVKRKSSGRRPGSWCYGCKRARNAKHYAENRDVERAKRRAYYRENREAAYARHRAWVAANRQAWAAYQLEYQRGWRLANPVRAAEIDRAADARRQARIRAGFVEPIDRHVVLASHDGICGICGTPVDPDEFHIDHIVAVSRGGEHSYANVQPAHPACNLRKASLAAPHERSAA